MPEPEPEPDIPVATNADVYEGMYFSEDTIFSDSFSEWAFDHSILIPEGFELGYMYGDESGIMHTFVNNDTGCSITVGARNNYNGEALEESYQNYQLYYDLEYSRILEDESAYVVSWVDSGREWYYKEYVGSGSIYYMGIEYHEDDPRGDAIVEQVAPTFEPGDIWSTH